MADNFVKGRAVLLLVEIDGEFKPVAGQQGGSLSRSVETQEITTKDYDHKEIIGTYSSWSLSCDGVYRIDGQGFEQLEDAFAGKEPIMVQFAQVDGMIFEGMALITEMSLDAGVDDICSYSVSLEGTGALTRKKADA